MIFLLRTFLLFSLVFVSLGCSVMQPRPVSDRVYRFNDLDRFVDVEYGKPNILTRVNDVKDRLISRIPLMPQPAGPQEIQNTVATSVDYLAKNEMHDVKVRVNQYAPLDELRRLHETNTVGKPLQYTLGVASIARYAVLPGQLTKADSYNPYTNTLNLNSGNAPIAIEQAAHAKDIRQRRMPNLYLLAKQAPGGELPGIVATKNEVINYFAMYGTPQQQQQATNSMIPRLTSQIGGEIGDFVPGSGPAFSIAGKVLGKAITTIRR